MNETNDAERIAALETRVAELEREKAFVRLYMERATNLYGRVLGDVEEIMAVLKRNGFSVAPRD
jgi:hypothetical protein